MASQPPVPDIPNESPVDSPIPSPTDPIPPVPTDPVIGSPDPFTEGP